MIIHKALISVIVSVLSVPLILASWELACFVYMNTGGDGSTGALLTCGDGTQYEVAEPYHNGDTIYPHNQAISYRETLDSVSQDPVRDGSNPINIYGFRCLQSELIGVSERGYFVFDNKRQNYFLTSDYEHWLAMLQRLKVSDSTLLYPGPIRDSYAKQGLLKYHTKERIWW